MRANNNARLGVPWLVCLRVCPSVCLLQPWVLQNGWTDWSVVCGINSAGPREHYWKSLLHQNAYPVARKKKQAENNNLNKLTINMNSPHMQHEKVEIKQNNL